MKRTSGTRPGGGGPFLASLTAQTTMRSTAVPRNCGGNHEILIGARTDYKAQTSSKKHDTEVMYGS